MLSEPSMNKSVEPSIHEAAAEGQEGAFEELLASGKDVNLTDQLGWTPLMHAIRNGHTQLAAELLSCGAQVCLCSAHGITAFTLGVLHFDEDLLQTLYDKLTPELRQIESNWALQVACLRGCYSAVKWLLDNTLAQVNFVSPITGVTPLMLAVMGCADCKLTELLLKSGAQTGILSALGQNVFDLALASNNKKLFDLLHHSSSPTQQNCFSFKKIKNNHNESLDSLYTENNIYLDVQGDVVLKNSPGRPVFKSSKDNELTVNDVCDLKRLLSPSLRSVFLSPQQRMSQSWDSNGFHCQYNIAAMVSPYNPVKTPNRSKKRKLHNIKGCSSWLKRITTRRTKSLPDEDDYDDLNIVKPNGIDLTQLLGGLGLDDFFPVFKEHELDIWTFLSLTSADLAAMGITNPSAKAHILKSIETLKKTQL